MTEPSSNQNPISMEELDRLVDGELAEDERRRLLRRLEEEPAGWRRCALAFLENQTWGEVFQQPASRDVEPEHLPRNRAAGQSPFGAKHGWLNGFALAASLLLAFFLGRQEWTFTSDPNGAPAENQIAESPVTPPSLPNPGNSPDPAQARTVTVSLGGGQPALEVPLAESPGTMRPWLSGQTPLVSNEFLDAWQQHGHEVRRQRSIVPAQSTDGQRVLIPLEQVDLRWRDGWGFH